MARIQGAATYAGMTGAAILFSFAGAAPVQAACVSDGSTVTCPDAGTGVTQVNVALFPPFTTAPDVSLMLPGGSSVVNDGQDSIYVSATRDSRITVDAASTVGANIYGASENETVTGAPVLAQNVSGSGVTQTLTQTDTRTATGGTATAIVAGVVTGEVSIGSNRGSAALLLTGNIRGGVAARSVGSDRGYQTIFSSSGPALANLTLDSLQASEQWTPVGGTASIFIQSPGSISAVDQGEIYASGVGGSSVTIASGSRVFPDHATGGAIWLDSYFYDHAQTVIENYAGAGTANSTRTEIATGGISTFTNAGTVGVAGSTFVSGYYDAPTVVDVDSPDWAILANSGALYGDAHLWAVGGTFTEVIESSGINDPASRVDRATRYYTSSGGRADFGITGLVTGDLTMTAGTGSGDNDGVIRGGVYLGASVGNFTVETTRTGGAPYEPETIIALIDPFAQTYSLNQNGLIAGAHDGVAISVAGAVEGNGRAVDPSVTPPSGQPLLTNSVSATIALNSGSVTLGDIVAEHDGTARYTSTAVTLNGTGHLGLSGGDATRIAESAAALAPFAVVDPLLADATLPAALGAPGVFTAGSRILGIDSLAKTGAGTFVITGGSYSPASGSTDARWTVDVGSFAVRGGEVQLDVAPYSRTALGSYDPVASPLFGIRGNVVNEGSLVLGRRVASAPYGIEGITLYVNGDFTQSADGRLTFASTFRPIASAGSGIPLSSSFVTLDGNLSLAGTVDLLTDGSVLYTNGIRTDLFSVNGTVQVTASTLINGLDSPFLDFTFVERSEGGRTIVSVEADHASYTTVAAASNSEAVGAVLDLQTPSVLAFLADNTNLAGLASVDDAQELAALLTALDTQTDATLANAVLRELAGGAFYGSLLTTRTTDAFGDLTRGVHAAGSIGGVDLWFNPTGIFSRNDGNARSGASATKTRNYGGSAGITRRTSGGSEAGFGIGYGSIEQRERDTATRADGDTVMIGAFANRHLDGLDAGIQIVYGWTQWDARRAMPLFSRTATSRFKSEELRVLGEVSHAFAINSMAITPFVRGDLRYYSFDGFTETGGDAIGLIVEQKGKTLFSPEVGTRATARYETASAIISPELSASYTLQADTGSSRDMAFVVNPATPFRVRGVDPDAFFTFGAGLKVEGRAGGTAYLRGSYITGGDQSGVAVSLGMSIGL